MAATEEEEKMATVTKVEDLTAEVVVVAICLLREVMAAITVIMTETTEEVQVEWTVEEATVEVTTSQET